MSSNKSIPQTSEAAHRQLPEDTESEADSDDGWQIKKSNKRSKQGYPKSVITTKKRQHLEDSNQFAVLATEDVNEKMQMDSGQETEQISDTNKSNATLAAMAAGSILGWTSPALPQLQGKLSNLTISNLINITADSVVTDEEASWIGSLLAVGALLGALPAGYLADKLGRRSFLLSLGIPFIIGWFLIFIGHHVHQVPILYAARFILGVAVGSVTVVVPLYNSEIAEDSIRGALGSYLQLMITIGILWVYIFGALVDYDFGLPIACIAIPIAFCIFFAWMPESPIYLLSKGRIDDAEKSVKWLRGVQERRLQDYDVDAEIIRLQKSIRESRAVSQNVTSIRRSLKYIIGQFILDLSLTSPTAKAVEIVFGLMIFQQLSGINAVIFYTGKIFEDRNSFLEPTTATIVVGAVQVIATYVSTLLVDRLGRRVLLLVSDGGMSICLLLLSIYFYYLEQNTDMSGLGWLPLVSLAMYIILFSIGLGPLPWFMMAELVPAEAKRWASALAVCLNWSLVFTVTKVFPTMMTELGTCLTFVAFAVICIVGTIFVAAAVPETKGKSLIQIQRELGKT